MSKDSKKSTAPKVHRNALAVNKTTAGAGVAGLVGFLVIFAVASVFLVTENYFFAMLTASLALLVYVTGFDIVKIVLSSFTIFFSSKHLIPKAAYLQETLAALREVLQMKRNEKGEISTGAVTTGARINLPDNELVKDVKRVVEDGKNFDYAEYVAHSYYVECHELYEYTRANLAFVADSMPLFGLIGTIVGLISMFEGLGADVTVESLSPQLAIALKTTLYGAVFSSIYRVIGSRFDQRLKTLDYDYETFCRALQVIVENKNIIEVD